MEDEIATMEIPLSQGLVALIDEEDFAFVSQWKWHVDRCGKAAYARRYRRVSESSGGQVVWLSRELLNAPDDMLVDHINGDTLDNRRCNLRLASPSQNNQNRRSRAGSTSQYVGVCWDKNHQRWRAAIQVERRSIYLGLFADEADAGRAYDSAAREHFGEFAQLNFPMEQDDDPSDPPGPLWSYSLREYV